MATTVLAKVGKTIELTLVIGLSLFGALIALKLGSAWLVENFHQAGPKYFYMRQQFGDVEASKNPYTFIDPNAEDVTPLFTTYSSYMQPIRNPKTVKTKRAEISAILEKYQNSVFFRMRNLSGVKDIQKQYDEYWNTLAPEADARTTVLGTTPLYSGSFTDAFVIKPRWAYKIFHSAGQDGYDKAKLDAEIDFLSFRCVFIEYLLKKADISKNYELKNGGVQVGPPKNWVAISKRDIDAFCGGLNMKVSDKLMLNNYPLKEIEEVAGQKINVVFTDQQLKGFEKYHKAIPRFRKVLELLEADDPVFIITGDKIEIVPEFVDRVYELVTTLTLGPVLGLPDLVAEAKTVLSTILVKFAERLACIKPNVMDIQVLNRFYYFYLFTHSFYQPDCGSDKKDKAYSTAEEEFNKLLNTIAPVMAEYDALVTSQVQSGEQNPTPVAGLQEKQDQLKELFIRLGVQRDKMGKRRVELIFNHLSKIIARNLGSDGFVLKTADDHRNFFMRHIFSGDSFFRLFPAFYIEKQQEKVEPAPLKEI